MKTLLMTIATLMIFIFISTPIQAQKTQQKLNQTELYKQYIGKWQAEIGIDSMEIRECREFGLSFIIETYQVIKGKKTPLYINNISFDSNQQNFKGFLLYPNGGYFTWIGKFTDAKNFAGKIVFNFNPDVAWSEFRSSFINADEFKCTSFIQENPKITELNFKRIISTETSL